MRNKVFYLFGVCFLVGITYLSVSAVKSYLSYTDSYSRWQLSENAWQKAQRNSLTPREWGELKIQGDINSTSAGEKRVRRALTVFNQLYLQKKYLETNAGNVVVKNISWRDVLKEDLVGFKKIKQDIKANIDFYSSIKSELKKNRDISIVKKSLLKKQFDQIVIKLAAVIGVLILGAIGFNYLFSEKYFYQKAQRLDEHENSVSSMEVPSLGDSWNLGDLVDDFCHEVRLKCEGAKVLFKTDTVFVDQKIYDDFELGLKPLSKVIEFLNVNNQINLHVSLWNSNNKIYLFTDFISLNLEQNLESHGHLANKFLQVESFLSSHAGQVKVLSLKKGNKTRLVLSFNSTIETTKNEDFPQYSA